MRTANLFATADGGVVQQTVHADGRQGEGENGEAVCHVSGTPHENLQGVFHSSPDYAFVVWMRRDAARPDGHQGAGWQNSTHGSRARGSVHYSCQAISERATTSSEVIIQRTIHEIPYPERLLRNL